MKKKNTVISSFL